jgi:CHAT domain-containing protein
VQVNGDVESSDELGEIPYRETTFSAFKTSMQRNAGLNKILSLGSALALFVGVAHFPVQAQSNAPSTAQSTAAFPPEFKRKSYNPAVLHLQFTPLSEGRTTPSGGDAFLDITLIPSSGNLEGVRVELTTKEFRNQLRNLYVQLSRQDSLKVDDSQSPSRQLHALLFESLMPILQREKVTTLLISADRGLQAVPFAALSDGQRYFGDRYAFSITPSLALTDLSTSGDSGQRRLAMGASEFKGLAALPLVPQELDRIGPEANKDQFLNKEFTPDRFMEKAGESTYNQLHVATHAEFKPGGPKASQLHSGVGPISMDELAKLRKQRQGVPLDLVVFSACRTALGDANAELGFSGLALQAGARSAVGTLWYVDDVVTSAYFVQMYSYLDQGIPKAEAMQLTRQAFVRNLVRLDGDRVMGVNDQPLLLNLTPSQQRRVSSGVNNPFFWAGIELMGSPW